MFRAWAFTEMPYPHIPPEDTFESARVNLPNRIYDPEVGHHLYRTYFDIYRAADELGLDIMVNEHHATHTCVEPAVPLSLAILARETRHARLLALGNPVANRRQPVRVAEEMAMVDVISQGRLEAGFVRGVPQELSAGNSNPVDMKDRFWEALDLVVAAWRNHEEPFSWEGEHFHHRQVNVWPRVYQDPHPPIWIPTQTPSSALDIADRQYTVATILNGAEGARRIFETYRQRTAEHGLPEPEPERFAYCGLVFVGEDDRAGFAGAKKLQWYLQHNKGAIQFMDVPGYSDIPARAAMLKRRAMGEVVGNPLAHFGASPIEDLAEQGVFFAGGPDTVLEQLRTFHDAVGGFGNLLMMVQGGTMGLELTTRSMELFAREVLPRFRALVDPPVGDLGGTGHELGAGASS